METVIGPLPARWVSSWLRVSLRVSKASAGGSEGWGVPGEKCLALEGDKAAAGTPLGPVPVSSRPVWRSPARHTPPHGGEPASVHRAHSKGLGAFRATPASPGLSLGSARPRVQHPARRQGWGWRRQAGLSFSPGL